MKKRLTAMLLAVCMLFTFMPTAFAANDTTDLAVQAEKTLSGPDNDGNYTITLSVKGGQQTSTGTQSLPADVVLVVDTSTSMDDTAYIKTCGGSLTSYDGIYNKYTCTLCGAKYRDEQASCTARVNVNRLDVAKAAAKQFASGLFENDDVKIGLYDFSGSNRTNVALTSNENTVEKAIENLSMPRPGDGTDYTLGLTGAENILKDSTSGRKQFIVFISDGEPQQGGNGNQKANQLMNSGVTIVTVGIDVNNSAANALRAISSSGEDGKKLFFESSSNGDSSNALNAVLKQIQTLIESTVYAGTDAVLTDGINLDDFDYVDNSLTDGGENVELEDGTLTWNIGNIGNEKREISFQVKPKEDKTGKLYTNTDVYLTYKDTKGNKVTIQKEDIGHPYIVVASPVVPSAAAYKVEHYKENLDGSYSLTETEFPLYGKIGETVTAEAKNYEHYTEDTANANCIASGTVEMPSTESPILTLKLYYKLDQHTITFTNGDGNGTVGDDNSVSNSYKFGASFPEAPATAANENYVFDGWYLEDGTEAESFPTTVTEDATYVAHWREIKADVPVRFFVKSSLLKDVGREFFEDTNYHNDLFNKGEGQKISVGPGYAFINKTSIEHDLPAGSAEYTTATQQELAATGVAIPSLQDAIDALNSRLGLTGDKAYQASDYAGISYSDAKWILITGSASREASWHVDIQLLNSVTYQFVSATEEKPLPSGITAPAVETDVEGTEMTLPSVTQSPYAADDGVWEFIGWTAPEGVEVEENQYTMPAKNITFVGTWEFTPYSSDISVSKEISSDKDTYKVGDEVIYNITVTNSGKAAATGLTVTDTLPAGLEFVSATEGHKTPVTDSIVWTDVTVPAEGTTTFEVKAKVKEITADTPLAAMEPIKDAYAMLYANSVKVSNDDGTQGGATVKTPVKAAVIEKTLQNAEEKYHVGDQVTYKITVTNTGTEALTNVTVTETPGAGFKDGKFVEQDDQDGVTLNGSTATIATLPVGGQIVLTYQVTIASKQNSYSNTAVVSSGEITTDEVTTEDTISFADDPNITIKKTGESNYRKPERGEWVVYKLTVTNNDNVDYKNVVIVEDPDDELEYGFFSKDSDETPKKNMADKDGKYTIETLKANESVVVYYYAQISDDAKKGSDVDNVAIVTVGGKEIDRDKYTVEVYKKPSSSNSSKKDDDKDVALNKDDHFQYIFGMPDGTVRPLSAITRAEVAAIFYRLLDDDTRDRYFTTENDFPDVNDTMWYNKAVSTLVNAGILTGCPDGLFHGGRNITRAELATIIAKFDDSSYSGRDRFDDIAGHWARAYINSAAKNGWIVGDGTGMFRPYDDITRAEVMTMINAVLNRAVDEDGLCRGYKQWPDNIPGAWYYYQVIEATNFHDYDWTKSSEEDWNKILPDKIWDEAGR